LEGARRGAKLAHGSRRKRIDVVQAIEAHECDTPVGAKTALDGDVAIGIRHGENSSLHNGRAHELEQADKIERRGSRVSARADHVQTRWLRMCEGRERERHARGLTSLAARA